MNTEVRFPAEWEPHARTWMAWPARPATWSGHIDAALEAHVRVAKAIAEFEPVTMVADPSQELEAINMCGESIEVVPLPVSDGWMRDTGPTFVIDANGAVAGIDWIFDGWGGIHADWLADSRLAESVLAHVRARRIDGPLVLEGGAIHSDGRGTLLTTEQCLLSRNPGMSIAEIEEALKSTTGCTQVIWLGQGHDQDETRGHVDEIAFFARPGVVVLQMTDDTDDPNYEICKDNYARLSSAVDATGNPVEIVTLPQPERRDHDGGRLTLAYVNCYMCNGGLIVPQFDDRSDARALSTLGALFPTRKPIPLDACAIVMGGGGIHCITQPEPKPTSDR